MNAPFPLSDDLRASSAPIRVMQAQLHDAATRSAIAAFVEGMAGEGATPFHRPEWLMAVEAGTGQRATGLIARAGSVPDAQVIGWLPLTLAHSPLFGRALVSSGFAVGGGILASDPAAIRPLCAAAGELAQRCACASVELRGPDAPAGWARIEGKHDNFAADLAEDDEAQLLAIPRKQRAEVRKGLRAKLEVTTGSAEADRAAHHAVYSRSVHNLGTPVFPRSLFDAMLDAFGKDADILTVRRNGHALASVLSFYHDGTVMPFWGGGVWEARDARANEVMYYALMCHARRRGCTRFDFGRSKVRSGPWHYKKNWGFEPEPLMYREWRADGRAGRNVDPTADGYSRAVEAWKRLPASIADRVGPWIARGLA